MSGLRIVGVRDPATGNETALEVLDGHVVPWGGAPSDAHVVDGSGAWLSPGFIDLQLNGAQGSDFAMEPEAAWQVGDALAATGVTAFLPTIVSSPPDTYRQALEAWTAHPTMRGAEPLGWHFEGPLLSPARAGAHDRARLCEPAELDTTNWSATNGVRMVTLAPELPGALDLIRTLAGRGVVVAAGHTDATADRAASAVDAGLRYATHLLNAMRGLDAREPGLAAGLLADDRVTIGVITDGHHLADATLSMVWRLAGDHRVSVVTDGIAAFGLGPGICKLGGRVVHVAEDGSARRADGTLAGAVTPLPQALRRLQSATGAHLSQVLETVTSVPARLLDLPERGHLRPGARADVVLLDDDLSPLATFVSGELVHVSAALR
jgi:N-acetylglucosamine-6-phosphate deacetylase